MNPIKHQTFFVKTLLITLATAFVFLTLMFLNETVTVWPNVWGYIEGIDPPQPIILGVFPAAHLLFFLSFLCVYLIFEFYGFKSSLYTLINLLIIIFFSYFFFEGLRWLSVNTEIYFIKSDVLQTFSYPRQEVATLAAAFFSSCFVTIFLAAFIRKLTKNYFMFIRYPISALLGFGCFVFVKIYLEQYGAETSAPWHLVALVPATQFAIAIIGSLIPLYLFRLFLGLFKGWTKKEKIHQESENFNVPEKEVTIT